MGRGSTLRRAFYRAPADQVAPLLLNKLLIVTDGRAGRIVEVEAYGGGDDPASHAYRGVTPRNQVMFADPGMLYVYLSYGVHWCANAVCGPAGEASAVLIRALEPVRGVELMRATRPEPRSPRRPRSTSDRDLCRGPGRLCRALGVDGTANGVDLTATGSAVRIVDDGIPPPERPATSGRIGITKGTEREWRFAVPDHPCVSGPPPWERPGIASPSKPISN
jgi:DNA-3-methyladenine glycosylase